MTSVLYALGSLLRACGFLDDEKEDKRRLVGRWLVVAGAAVKLGAAAMQASRERTHRPRIERNSSARAKLVAELAGCDPLAATTNHEDYVPGS
jgi:hypothetical protein